MPCENRVAWERSARVLAYLCCPLPKQGLAFSPHRLRPVLAAAMLPHLLLQATHPVPFSPVHAGQVWEAVPLLALVWYGLQVFIAFGVRNEDRPSMCGAAWNQALGRERSRMELLRIAWH
jgi:hypothetical protein